jgi:hydrogenase expression/formation protein HypC
MCLAVPARVIEIHGTSARVDILGNQTTADISVLPDVRVGDYIMIHAGFGIQKYNEDEAQKTLELLAELAEKTGGL